MQRYAKKKYFSILWFLSRVSLLRLRFFFNGIRKNNTNIKSEFNDVGKIDIEIDDFDAYHFLTSFDSERAYFDC